jgi:hypothetical protein
MRLTIRRGRVPIVLRRGEGECLDLLCLRLYYSSRLRVAKEEPPAQFAPGTGEVLPRSHLEWLVDSLGVAAASACDCSVLAMLAEAEDSSAGHLRLMKAQKVFARRPVRPMQSGLPQPAARGTAAAGSGGRRPRGSWVPSGSASHDDEQDRGPDAADLLWWMDRWCAGPGRRAGNAGHDAPDAWGIGRQWGPPIGARGCGSAGRTTRGEGGEPRGAF